MIKLNNVEISQEDLIKEITGNKELMATLQSKFSKQKSVWFVPEKGEEYYFQTHVGSSKAIFCTFYLDGCILKRQQVFRTQEEAEKTDQQRMAKVRILKRIAEENAKEGWVCDWNDGGQEKCFIYYHHDLEKNFYGYAREDQVLESGFYMSETVAGKLKTELLQDYKIMLGKK